MDELSEDGVLSVQFLKSASNEFDISSIHTISLTSLNLTDISAISGCTGLERLDLSHNLISDLHSLASLPLHVLDLSDNRISSLSGLESLNALQNLDLSGNLLGSIDMLPLVSHQDLRCLRLHNMVKDFSNPVCKKEGYRSRVLRLLPQLDTLDDVVVNGADSEVFKLIERLEHDMAYRRPPGQQPLSQLATHPIEIADDLFTVKKLSQEQDVTEEQFRIISTKSEQLNRRSTQFIEEAKKMLKANDAV